MVFIACVKHYEENFSGISSFGTLSSPMRQASLLLTERKFEAQRVGVESQTIRGQ